MQSLEASEHEALLQFVYMAPVGLVQFGPVGDIHFINPLSAALLMPLSSDGSLDNLFAVLEPVAPELRKMFDDFAASSGTVCEGYRVQLTAGVPGREDAKVLGLSIVKLDPSRAMAVVSDVSLIVKRERQLRQSEAWVNAILTGVQDYALMTLDGEGRVQQWNESIGRVTGLAAAEVIGRPFSVFYPAGGITAERLTDRLREADDNGWSLDDGWRLRGGGGRFWGSVMIAPLESPQDVDAAARSYGLILRDITDKREAAEQLRRAHAGDDLTGLFNRRAFFEAAELELERWRRAPRPLSLVMIDADHFKAINDRYGHPGGDAVLGDLGQVIAETVRGIDTAARVGGEEFAVLLPSTDGSGATAFAQRLCAAVRGRSVVHDGKEIRYTVSVGVATLREDFAGLDALMKQADAALYDAKAAGRDRVRAWHDPASA